MAGELQAGQRAHSPVQGQLLESHRADLGAMFSGAKKQSEGSGDICQRMGQPRRGGPAPDHQAVLLQFRGRNAGNVGLTTSEKESISIHPA